LKILYRIANILFLALLPALITFDIFDGAIGTYLWTKEINIWLIILPILYFILIVSFVIFLIFRNKIKTKPLKKFLQIITYTLLGLTFIARLINITSKASIYYFIGMWLFYLVSCIVYVSTKKEIQ